jgi:hypothetical protein
MLLIVTFVLAAAGVAYAALHWQPRSALDADSCPPAPVGTWLAAIDVTDLRPPQEQERMWRGLLDIPERMSKHERFTLHVIGGDAELSAAPFPLTDQLQGFRLCKPSDPKLVNRHVENERLAQARYQRDFLDPLRAALSEIVNGGVADRSPILQAIEVMMWSPHFGADIPQRTLVLFSDMLNHTRDHSHLTGPLPHPCQVLASPIGKRLQGHNWSGVRVIIHYLRNPRDAHRQGPDHLRFWADLFYLFGAAEVLDGGVLMPRQSSQCDSEPSAKTAKTQLGSRR